MLLHYVTLTAGPDQKIIFGLSLDPNKSRGKTVRPWITIQHPGGNGCRVMTKWHETQAPEKYYRGRESPG